MSADAAELQQSLAKFQSNNPWIYQVAGYFSPHFKPIPWEYLQAGLKDNYVQSYLVPSYALAKSTMNSIDLKPTEISSEQATQAAKILFDDTKGLYDRTVAAGKVGWEIFRSDDSMQVVGEVLRVFVVSSFAQAEQAFKIHHSGAALSFAQSVATRINSAVQAGRMSYEDGQLLIMRVEKTLQEHAQAANSALRAISWLDDQGYLAKVKKGAVGAIPIGVAILLGIAAIAAVATIVICAVQITAVNELIKEECSKISDDKQRVACIQSVSSHLPQIDAGGMVSGAMKWVVFGGLAVLGVYFAPVVVRSLKAAVKEARA